MIDHIDVCLCIYKMTTEKLITMYYKRYSN